MANTFIWISNPHKAYGPGSAREKLSANLADELARKKVLDEPIFYDLRIPPEKFLLIPGISFSFNVPEEFGFEKLWFSLHPSGRSFQDLSSGTIKLQIQLDDNDSPPSLIAQFLKTWLKIPTATK